MDTKEICTVVRGQLGGEDWGWDVIDSNDVKLAHYGTQSDAETFADGYAAGRRAEEAVACEACGWAGQPSRKADA